jgi:alkanesulfonate monooxygenase SsuD/methylene tetrahydromethanopterin reductase-like flavin-dependent oxidoreductase (luciferase family)
MEEEHTAFGLAFPETAERWERFEEALAYLEAAFGEGHSRFQGRHYSLDATVRPKPTGLRVIVGGSGPRRTPALAGERADEYNCLIRPTPEIAARIEVMRQATSERPVEATVMGPALVGRTDAEYRERLSAAAARRSITTEEMEARYLKAGIPIGPPSRAAETIRALEEAGVQRWYVQWLAPGDLEGFAVTMEALRAG